MWISGTPAARAGLGQDLAAGGIGAEGLRLVGLRLVDLGVGARVDHEVRRGGAIAAATAAAVGDVGLARVRPVNGIVARPRREDEFLAELPAAAEDQDHAPAPSRSPR